MESLTGKHREASSARIPGDAAPRNAPDPFGSSPLVDFPFVVPEEVEKYRNMAGTVIREAVREGKVLYERAA